ncbi:hypothetical protein AAMO2058_001192900, partial [Amorphochlora amoebiformis]
MPNHLVSIHKQWTNEFEDYRTKKNITLNDRLRSGYSIQVALQSSPTKWSEDIICKPMNKLMTWNCNKSQRESHTHTCSLPDSVFERGRVRGLGNGMYLRIKHPNATLDFSVIHQGEFWISPQSGSGGMMWNSPRKLSLNPMEPTNSPEPKKPSEPKKSSEPKTESKKSSEPKKGTKSTSKPEGRKKNPQEFKISACLAGPNYAARYLREVIEYYKTIGFTHVYLGMPLGENSPLLKDISSSLHDYTQEGFLTLAISHYSDKAQFHYDLNGHRSAFNHACGYHARFHGDHYVYLGDIDEFPIPANPGIKLPQAISEALQENNYSYEENCAINLYGCVAIRTFESKKYMNKKPRFLGNIFGAQQCVTDRADSASVYGKALHNVRMSMRYGQHATCFCENMNHVYQACVKHRLDTIANSTKIIEFRDVPCQIHMLPRKIYMIHFLNFLSTRYCTKNFTNLAHSPYTTDWFPTVKANLVERKNKYGIDIEITSNNTPFTNPIFPTRGCPNFRYKLSQKIDTRKIQKVYFEMLKNDSKVQLTHTTSSRSVLISLTLSLTPWVPDREYILARRKKNKKNKKTHKKAIGPGWEFDIGNITRRDFSIQISKFPGKSESSGISENSEVSENSGIFKELGLDRVVEKVKEVISVTTVTSGPILGGAVGGFRARLDSIHIRLLKE